MSEMTALQVLEAGRALIADTARWTQGACARDAKGTAIDAGSVCATRFCTLGALNRIGGWEGPARRRAGSILVQTVGSIADFNDTHSHAEVLAAWDRAIERARVEAAA